MHLYGPTRGFANDYGDTVERAGRDAYRNVRVATTTTAEFLAVVAQCIVPCVNM